MSLWKNSNESASDDTLLPPALRVVRMRCAPGEMDGPKVSANVSKRLHGTLRWVNSAVLALVPRKMLASCEWGACCWEVYYALRCS